MAEFPTTFASELEIWTPDMAQSAELEDMLSALQERGMVAARGLTPELAWSLGVVAHQAHIVEFCASEPGRFGTENRAKSWQGKGREFFSLHEVDGFEGKQLSRDDLASVQEADLKFLAYGWAGPGKNKHIPDADITTAYRGTELGKGKRLASSLVKFVVGSTIQLHELEPETISLETWLSNERAVPLYKRNDFTEVAREWGRRSTLQEEGTSINGFKVTIKEDKPAKREVIDRRLFMRYDPDHRYNVHGR